MESSAPYPNDSLRWVAAEVRFPPFDDVPSGVVQAFRERVHDRFPIREANTELAVTMGPGGASAKEIYRHRFIRRDRLMSVTLGPESLTLEATEYDGWTSFGGLVAELGEALADTRRPDGIGSVALRYIDEIRVPDVIERFEDWDPWIDARLVAPLALHDGEPPTSATIALQYGLAPGYVTRFRAAPFEQGRTVQEGGPLRMPVITPDGPYFLLDTDASWSDPDRQVPEFDPDRVSEVFDQLHKPCKALYEASITRKLRDEVLRQPRQEEVNSA